MSVVKLEKRQIVDQMRSDARLMGMSLSEAVRAAKRGENQSVAATDILFLGSMLRSPLPNKAKGSQRISKRS